MVSHLHCFFISCMQMVLRLTQSSTLSASCSRLLLQITSSLLLGENITLPKSLIQEMIQKVCPWSLKIKFHFCVWEVSYMWSTWICLFFRHKIFSSMLGQDLILEFTKEMFTMKEFEQVSHFCYMSLSDFLCTSVTRPTSSSSSSFYSSSFPPCCASSLACSAATILTPATLALMYWSAWSLPRPHPPQMAPWLLKPTRCSSPDRPQGQIPRTFFILPPLFPPVFTLNVCCCFFPAGFSAISSPAALQISQESQSWCCLSSQFLRRRQSSLTCHCCGALWCFCHTSGNTYSIVPSRKHWYSNPKAHAIHLLVLLLHSCCCRCILCWLMSHFKIISASPFQLLQFGKPGNTTVFQNKIL